MFTETLKRRNQKLINAAFQLHQEGCVTPDSYIIDVDIFLENAKKILNEAKKYGIKLYYMTKQIGRNPYLGKKLQEMGYSGVVAVDFREAEVFLSQRDTNKVHKVSGIGMSPKGANGRLRENPGVPSIPCFVKHNA